jgi:hypothetical protein
VGHFNHLSKRPLSVSDPRIFLPGYSDQLVYELGLIDTTDSFAETKSRANVSALARQHRDDPNFSQAIRAGWATTRR